MNKELLTKRLEDLNKQRQITISNVAAYDGAIQETQYWMAVIKQKEDLDKQTSDNSNQQGEV